MFQFKIIIIVVLFSFSNLNWKEKKLFLPRNFKDLKKILEPQRLWQLKSEFTSVIEDYFDDYFIDWVVNYPQLIFARLHPLSNVNLNFELTGSGSHFSSIQASPLSKWKQILFSNISDTKCAVKSGRNLVNCFHFENSHFSWQNFEENRIEQFNSRIDNQSSL